MARRTAMLVCAATLFAFWLAAALGHGNGFLGLGGLSLVAAVVAAVVKRFLRRRRYSAYGSELQYAVSVISDRDRWADLAEILGLTVDTEVRRSRIARAFGYRSRDCRAARYIPAIVETEIAPYGLALTVLSVPGQSRDNWHRRCGQLSSVLRVKQVTVTEDRPGIIELQLRVRDPLRQNIVLASVPRSERWTLPFGVNEEGVSIAGPCQNVSGVVVGGVPGGGKSAWRSMALATWACRKDVQWLLIDGKQGYDLEPLALRAYRYISGDEAGDLEVVKAALQDV